LPNHFTPMGIEWNPDGSQLWIRFGFEDTGYGIWFPHDAKTGQILEGKEELAEMRNTAAEDRKGAWYSRKAVSPEVVWDRNGKVYGSWQAPDKLYNYWNDVLCPSPRGQDFIWRDGLRYVLFTDRVGNETFGYVICDGKLVGSVPLAGPVYEWNYAPLIFTQHDGILFLKTVWQWERWRFAPEDENAEKNGGLVTCTAELNLGKGKIWKVMRLDQNRLILECNTETQTEWLLLDIDRFKKSGRPMN